MKENFSSQLSSSAKKKEAESGGYLSGSWHKTYLVVHY